MKQATILVLGLGASGRAAVNYFLAQGAMVHIADERPASPTSHLLAADLPPEKAIAHYGPFATSLLDGADCVVISPGIAMDLPIVREAIKRKIELTSEIEIFAREIGKAKIKPKIAAISGTNGKTTVTSLVAHLLQSHGLSVLAAGNIGPAALQAWLNHQDAPPAFWSLELSSFQLETLHSLKPDVATVLNISEDHLDRHTSIENYARAKAHVFDHAALQVLNRQDARVMAMKKQALPIITFGLDAPPHAEDFGVQVIDGQTWLMRGITPLIPTQQLSMKGDVGAANAMAALALCQGLGIEAKDLIGGLSFFQPPPHRTEWVATWREVSFFDDSKGTNVGATLAALNYFHSLKQPVILLAGGDGKGQDFTPLTAHMKKTARALVVLGKDAELLAKAAPHDLPVVRVKTMNEAVQAAATIAQTGDAVLLSPACSSLDMFANYAARGRAFRTAVHHLLGKNANDVCHEKCNEECKTS